jgi:hypothetical protein
MLELIQGWYREAAALYGDDWPRIEAYVAQKMSGISQADRAKLESEFSAFRPGACGRLN